MTGAKAAERREASAHSGVVIPPPHPELANTFSRYALENLLPH